MLFDEAMQCEKHLASSVRCFNKIMEYKLNGTEIIQPEKWVWGVVYSDDTELHQFKDGVFTQIKNIEWDRIKMFTMYKLEDPKKRIDMVVNETMKVFHKYINTKPYYSDEWIKTYMFGYKVKGTSETVYLFILPDDRIIMTNNIDNLDLVKFELDRV